jgi:hypothetical protein
MMRRSTHVFRFRTAGALLALLVGLGLPAAAPAAQVSVPATTTLGVGADGTVPVAIDSAAGVEGADFRFTYDPAVVQVTGDAIAATLISGCTPVSNMNNITGIAQVGFACSSALTGGGLLFSLPVRGQAPGASALTITRCDLNEGAIGCTPVSGTISVPSPTPTSTRTATPTSTPTSSSTPTRTATRTVPTATRTATRTGTSTRTPVPVVPPQLDPIASPITVGESHTLTGSGFTAGSVVKLFISYGGVIDGGAHVPTGRTANSLTWLPPSNLPLGSGFVTVVVINTDQNYIWSNPQSQLLFGSAAANIPTIRSINGVNLHAPDPSTPLAYVETVVAAGASMTITGTGFNNPLVNVFSASGNLGPRAPAAGWTSTFMQITLPANSPTGPGSVQVVNNPYVGNVQSNAVSVPIGALLSITSITQSGSTVTVDGTGFSTLSVINLFNAQSGGGTNLGGFGPNGPNVPLTIVSPNRFTFQVPATAQTGAAYVEVLNPPFIAYSSSGNDPDGAFHLVVP